MLGNVIAALGRYLVAGYLDPQGNCEAAYIYIYNSAGQAG